MIRKWILLPALLALLAVTSISAAGHPGDRGLDRARDVANEHATGLLATPLVVGVGVGATASGRPAIAVLTESAGADVPSSIDGVPVVVYVTGAINALNPPPHDHGKGGDGGGETTIDPTGRFDRPVPIGVSTGHPSITAGTIGARVTDGTDVYALSNNHVYAASNAASIGDEVIQPGTFDGGSAPADAIGTLADFEPIDFSGGNNLFDAAIAVSTTADLGNATPSDGYGTPSSAGTAVVGTKVMKYGRTTGQTKGRVAVTNLTVQVNYGVGVATFTNQLAVYGGSFSAGGDSGSLIVTQKGGQQAIGLLFAGGSNATIFSPIGPVLTRFGVTIDGN